MAPKWPTLEGRLKNSIKDRKTALLQLQKVLPLTELGARILQQELNKQLNKQLNKTMTKYLFAETDTIINAKIIYKDKNDALIYIEGFDNFDPFLVIGTWDKRGYYIDAIEPFINITSLKDLKVD